MRELIPIWCDPQIIDMTRLWKRFGNLTKRFKDYKEMDKWIKKAERLK